MTLLVVNDWGVPDGHCRLKALPLAVTLSPKLMVIVEPTATFVAPLAGVVVVTEGALSPLHGARGDAVLRGVGVPVEKSALLLSVSVQPFAARIAAVMLFSVGAGAAPLEEVGVPISNQVDDACQRRRRAGSRSCRCS